MLIEWRELLATVADKKSPLFLVCDGIEDPRNLGAIIRTADAVGVDGVIIPKRRQAPLSDTVYKTSTGAMDYVPIAKVVNINQTLHVLKEHGFWCFGLEASGDSVYTAVDYKGPVALVIGSEGHGLSRLVQENCDRIIRIPMHGISSSLNVSVATAVVLYEMLRQRHK